MGILIRRLAATALWLAAGAAHASSFTDFMALRGAGKLEEALQVLRNEFASPSFVHRFGGQPVYLRQHFLLALGELVQHRGLKPEHDAEARRIYQEGTEKFARDDGELRALMDNGMALYYSRSWRNGLALPYMRRELAHWERARNSLRLILTNDAIASAYWDMGEVELSRLFRERALELAAGYFVFGERPSDAGQWVEYMNLLGRYMDFASQLGDIATLQKLWVLKEPIGAHYVRLGSMPAFEAAQRFATAGQVETAAAILAKAKLQWTQERTRFNERIGQLGDVGQLCTEATLAFYARRYAEAAPALDRCAEGVTAMKLKENEASFEHKRGVAHENVGNEERALAAYRAAIASAETVRASYTVAERARFFRSFMRQSYWGLVRIQAKRAAGDAGAFFDAMYTSELVRGRQLGELVDADMQARISAASLKALQLRLPADTAVLAYTATEGEIVLLAMTREQTLAAVTPYDAKAFAAQVRAIAADLARPQSSAAELERRLLDVSKPLLAAARPLLAGRKQIIALPDGIMNMVPFDLLSAADDAYRPLVGEFTVAASPSLVFIQHAERRRRAGGATNLLAVADPKYSKSRTIAGASGEELKLATRGSRYLSYFEPLPETRSEAEAIAKMFGGQTVEVLAGENALESRVKSRELAAFGVLHFATHGILGGEVPGIGEPALVLGDEPDEDGFLTASEVSRLKLDSELTVLSACNTGSGEFVTGEGVMGMSRAFLAAGSRSVVVSLWPVASKQTERLMVSFYRHLRGGRPAAEALRAAKLEMVDEARKAGSIEAHPFFWAPFIVLGG